MSIIQEFEELKIPLEAIKTATDHFSEKNYLGRGGFGKVYRGELFQFQSDKQTMVAVKRLDRKFGQGEAEFWREIRMLSCYKHENIVSLIGFSHENEERVLVYEYVSRGSLDGYLSSTDLSWIQRLKICIGAARGLEYLHDPGTTQQRVLHCDIKSSNVLLDDNWNAKVSDFGLSKLGPANQQYTFLISSVGGTMGYCDPEYLAGKPFRKECDVYSFGVVLFEVLSGRICIVQSYDDERRLLPQLAQSRYKEGKLNEIIYDPIKAQIEPCSLRRFSAIAYRCLEKNQKNRPSMAEILVELQTAFTDQIMQDFVGSEHRSLVPTLPSPMGEGSRPAKMKKDEDDDPPIQWRKGELIGCGAFARVFMGMNLDSGKLFAVKQVFIVEAKRTQAHIKELEEEMKLLKNLSHPNIVRYLGTAIEEVVLNIFLEFVPGGSISSLLGKFGSFPESVIRMYTKQLLLALEYLHKNGIVHRDIKGANILVDDKGCIKLSDFSASIKVIELARIGATSMKGTSYWMAPEVILQTGFSFSADIWSVGCTVIEMATGKPPWSQQYQEVAALFHVATTKAHPPIPDHLSVQAKNFLLKCLQKEPNVRPNVSELLQDPFVTGEYEETHLVFRASVLDNSGNRVATTRKASRNSISPEIKTNSGLVDLNGTDSVRCSAMYPEKVYGGGPNWGTSNYDDDMCEIDDKDDFMARTPMQFGSSLVSDDVNESFNPMTEPNDDWPCKFDESPELGKSATKLFSPQSTDMPAHSPGESGNEDSGPPGARMMKLQKQR